jgi:hypothetical protein
MIIVHDNLPLDVIFGWCFLLLRCAHSAQLCRSHSWQNCVLSFVVVVVVAAIFSRFYLIISRWLEPIQIYGFPCMLSILCANWRQNFWTRRNSTITNFKRYLFFLLIFCFCREFCLSFFHCKILINIISMTCRCSSSHLKPSWPRQGLLKSGSSFCSASLK